METEVEAMTDPGVPTQDTNYTNPRDGYPNDFNHVYNVYVIGLKLLAGDHTGGVNIESPQVKIRDDLLAYSKQDLIKIVAIHRMLLKRYRENQKPQVYEKIHELCEFIENNDLRGVSVTSSPKHISPSDYSDLATRYLGMFPEQVPIQPLSRLVAV